MLSATRIRRAKEKAFAEGREEGRAIVRAKVLKEMKQALAENPNITAKEFLEEYKRKKEQEQEE